MIDLFLIGIGTGNPDHLTRQAVKALNAVDLVMIPKKSGKADLAELRHAILAEVVTNPAVQIAEFDLPVRDAANPDYEAGVNDWHDAIAAVWAITLAAYGATRVALLVWGDHVRKDTATRFSETQSAMGEIGTILAKDVLPIAFAHAGRLAKYGA